MTLKIFPWDNDIEPYFVNDKGLEWYVNDSMSRWCYRPTANDLPELKAICFYCCRERQRKGHANQHGIIRHRNKRNIIR